MKPIHPGRGFTLVEVLVVITIVGALAAVVVPISQSFFERGHERNCAANLRQIGVATMLYAADNQMTLPATSHQRRQGLKSWTLTLQPYADGSITFKCRKDPDPKRAYTYLINDYLTPNPAGAPDLDYSRLAKIDRPESTLMFAEASETYQSSDHFHFSEYYGGPVPDAAFESQVNTHAHADRSNYLFADGHIETMTRKEVLARIAAEGSTFVDPTTPEVP